MEASVRTADNIVVQIGSSLGERSDSVIVPLADATYQSLLAALAQPNGGVTLVGTTVTALAYVAPTPPPPPPNANQGFIAHLQGISLTSGGEADVLRQGVIQYLQGQPAVPAV